MRQQKVLNRLQAPVQVQVSMRVERTEADKLDAAVNAWLAAHNLIGDLSPQQRVRYRRAMTAAFFAAGVEFIEQNGGGLDVRLRSAGE